MEADSGLTAENSVGSVEKLLQDPTLYYERLSRVKDQVYKNSCFNMPPLSSKSMDFFAPRLSRYLCFGPWPGITEDRILSYNESFSPTFQASDLRGPDRTGKLFYDFESNRPVPKLLGRMIEARNMLTGSYLNVMFLRQAGFIRDRINYLFVDESRIAVVKLHAIDVDSIGKLTVALDKRIRSCLIVDSSITISQETIRAVINMCNDFLNSAGFAVATSLSKQDPSDANAHNFAVSLSRVAILTDLAVLMYAAAHTSGTGRPVSIDSEPKAPSFPFASDVSLLSGDQVMLRSMTCLNGFLNGRKAWIIRPRTSAYGETLREIPENTCWNLSTNIETLSDIWGPIWKVSGRSSTGILQYAMGSGSIVPWKPENAKLVGTDEYTDEYQVQRSERLCHWLPFDLAGYKQQWQEQEAIRLQTMPHKDDSSSGSYSSTSSDIDMESESNLDHPRESPYGPSSFDPEQVIQWAAFARRYPLHDDDELLIGASTSLQKSPCHCSSRRFRRSLENRNSLHRLGTRRKSSYIDAKSVGIGLTYQGIGGRTDAIVKTDHLYFKDILVQEWKHNPKSRRPAHLKHFGGVLVSQCSGHAMRCRISTLLAAESLQNVLKPLNWNDHMAKECFLAAIRDANPSSLEKLWRDNPEWRDELGETLFICLEELQKTGLDEGRGEFNVLWIESESYQYSERVILKPKIDRWVNFLRDSIDSCAMAVSTKDCFGAVTENGKHQICRKLARRALPRENQTRLPSRLQTAIQVNETLPPFDNAEEYLLKISGAELLGSWQTTSCCWRWAWNLKNLTIGSHIWITNPKQRLRVVEVGSDAHVLMECDDPVWDKLFDAVRFSPATRKGHREYVNDEHPPRTRPIHVHIQ